MLDFFLPFARSPTYPDLSDEKLSMGGTTSFSFATFTLSGNPYSEMLLMD
jgi:hypothetical protein